MFGMGMTEILLIVGVALVAIGPKKLPGVARGIGRGLAEFRRYTDELQHTVRKEMHSTADDQSAYLNDLLAHREKTKKGATPDFDAEKVYGTGDSPLHERDKQADSEKSTDGEMPAGEEKA